MIFNIVFLLIFFRVAGADETVSLGLRFLFNHGNESPTGTCTLEEFELFDNVMFGKYETTRYHWRGLYPAYCKKNCLGYRPGMCRVTNCNGFRRTSEAVNEEMDPFNISVSKEAVTACDSKKANALEALNEMYDQVSDSCRDFLMLPMDIDCFWI